MKLGRQDFTMRVKTAVAARVGFRCSNPNCRSPTAGPQEDPDKAVNIGVAAHISAASPGGPRYNPRLTLKERVAAMNAIWLCQNCAHLVDKDVLQFPEALLLKWKRDAKLEAKHSLGKTHPQRKGPAVTRVRRELALKAKLKRDFRNLWQGAEIIIHSDEDKTYPNTNPDQPGISPWFKVELWGLYHNGVEVVLSIEYAVELPDRTWAVVAWEQRWGPPSAYKVYLLGRIPFRNIVAIDMDGDEIYGGPHLYCHFADGGQPYEGFAAEVVDDVPYKHYRLDADRKIAWTEFKQKLEQFLTAEGAIEITENPEPASDSGPK